MWVNVGWCNSYKLCGGMACNQCACSPASFSPEKSPVVRHQRSVRQGTKFQSAAATTNDEEADR